MFRLLIFIALIAPQAFAQDPALSALTFQSWKVQQILEAQNQTLRISARIAQIKSGKGPATGEKNAPTTLPSGKIKKTEADPLASAERELKLSQESLQEARDLTLEAYVTVYLPTLADQPDAVATLAPKLAKEELVEIFKILVSRGPELKRVNAGIIEGLSGASRPK